jgi:hypothetical protein
MATTKKPATVRRKTDVRAFLLQFDEHASWDDAGQKWWLTLRQGDEELTVMQYAWEGVFTVYRRCERVWDVRESEVSLTELVDVLWGWRKALNKFFREVSDG